MSEQGEQPEVLPGDLITRPGLYESRSQGVVEVRHWGRDGWVAQWGDKERIYFSDGTRTGLYPMPDPYQLLHWVGPLPATEPATTSEQLAEIEGQAEDTPATGYTPPEGWRVLAVGEVLRDGDVIVHTDNAMYATARVGGWVGANQRYIRPIEPEPQPEPQSESIQVREGRWRQRNGDIRNVTPTPAGDGRRPLYPWWDAEYHGSWTSEGRYHFGETSKLDLVEYLGPIEQQPEPEPQPEPEHLQAIIAAQAETIARLQSEAHELNMEIGGLERQLLGRQARIQDLETMHAAATQAVVDAGKQNDKLRNLANNLRQQFEAAANEISEQRLYLDKYDKQLDQKDAQIRDLRIELDAAQQVPRPVGDEERERIWDEATEQAGRQVVRWLRPLADALSKQPDERFCRFMALTLSVLPDIVPELLGYAVENEVDCEE